MPIHRIAVAACLAAFFGCSGSPNHSSDNAGASDASSHVASLPADAGYYVEQATDLAAPPAGTGIHIETPDYDAKDPNASQLVVQPGQEIFLCYYLTLPNTSEIDVGGFQSWMSAGSSHHFILYQEGTGAFASGPFAASPQPSG